MKRTIVLAVAVVALVIGATACEPKMTITAHAQTSAGDLTCDPIAITGTVSPAKATPNVVLQWTAGGKWADTIGKTATDSNAASPHKIVAKVSQPSGSYGVDYLPPAIGTRHYRMRSAGSGAVSPGFYIKIIGHDGDC